MLCHNYEIMRKLNDDIIYEIKNEIDKVNIMTKSHNYEI